MITRFFDKIAFEVALRFYFFTPEEMIGSTNWQNKNTTSII